MFRNRIIPVLLLRNGGLVKTRAMTDARYLGDIVNGVQIFNDKGADELLVLDIDATREGRGPDLDTAHALASECFMPLAFGGGVRSLADAEALFRLGIEKVAINTAAARDPRLLASIANRFGAQAVVAAVDVRRGADGAYEVVLSGGREPIATPLPDHLKALEAAGCGEILVQDVDREGTGAGYDLELFRLAARSVDVPVIALGGAVNIASMAEVIARTGASAAAAGSLFVFSGRRRAVLINMPTEEEIATALRDVGSVPTASDALADTALPAAPLPAGGPGVPPMQPTPQTSSIGRVCTLTVLDESDPEIRFDDEGVSLLARKAQRRLSTELITGEAGQNRLDQIADRARREGRGREYDCIIGLSGGVDSSYVALLVKKMGLRPLAIHLDNGWNTDTAVTNVSRIVDRLDIDLHTVVINWNDVKDLQRAFFRASVPDVEVITDHAIVASVHHEAAKRGIRTMIFGVNLVTESIMPPAWSYTKRDAAHIRAIHKKFGERQLTNFPFIEPWDFVRYSRINGIRYESILSYADFDKKQAASELKEKLDYMPYTRKHGESRFTKFYQEYYLPKKFGYDKRKGHLSSLIVAGQLTRDEAFAELEKPLYDEAELERDIDYMTKKLGFSPEQWAQIMNAPPVSHDQYPGYYQVLKNFRKIIG